MAERGQRLPHAFHLFFKTGILVPQGSDYLVQVGHLLPPLANKANMKKRVRRQKLVDAD